MHSLMNGCRWIDAPAEGRELSVERWDFEARAGFPILRLFWLTNIGKGQWRGRHAHRHSFLATFAVLGGCQINLDNGEFKQTVELRHDGPGLVVGPWIWHDLVEFAPSTVILVAASTSYDESDYIRDYQTFLQQSRMRNDRSSF